MEELYEQNAKIVYHFLLCACKDEALAEELTQETFLKAFESIERFDHSCKISTWLCQIAKHLLYRHWKKEKKKNLAELDERLPAPDDTEKSAITKIELSAVWDALNSLPETMKEVVRLRALSDLSFREIGELMGKTETWARVTYYRAKTILIKETSYE